MNEQLLKQCTLAKQASRQMKTMLTSSKNQALKSISNHLKLHVADIIKENQKDIDHAIELGMADAMIDRLLLNEERILAMADDVAKLIDLEDPVGNII